MNSRPGTDGMDISGFFGVLRRRVLIILIAVLAAAAGAYYVSKGQDAKYSATTKLLLKGSPASASSAPVFGAPLPETAPDREAIVTQDGVIQRAERSLARRIGKQRAAEAIGGVEALSGQDSDVVDLTATSGSPKVAALAANTLAEANIAFRKDAILKEVRQAKQVATEELAQTPNTTDNAAKLTKLQADLAALRGFEATADGDAEVVVRATQPTSPSSPKPNRNALIGAFGGLLLGLALALVREQLDRRVRGSKELEDVFGLPVLASVPKSRAIASENGKTLEELPSREAEAFQMLRANLHYLNTERELRSVVVTSTGVGDGKSTIALNLAKADAIVGKRVLLVEADVRRPRLAPLLGLGGVEGLTAFLSDRTRSLADVTHRVPVVQSHNGAGAAHTLDVVVAGPVPANPSGLLDSDRMRELLREGEASYDLVVLDTPPATMVADAIPLMSEASAVVVVGRVGRITSGEADSLRDQLERVDAPAFGLVANFAPSARGYGYGYYGKKTKSRA